MYTKLWDGKTWQPAKTAPWNALGGAYSGPAVAVDVNDVALVYFAVGTDNKMYQVSTNPGAYGTGSLGGKFASLPAAFFGGYCDAPVKLLCNIYVLGLGTDNQVYCNTALSGGDFTPKPWQKLGEGASAPAGATTWSKKDGSDTTIHIVVLGHDGGHDLSVLHKSFSQAGASIVWNPSEKGWHSLGTPPSGVAVF